jgi:hypothetical protein
METIKVALVQFPKELLLKEIVLVYWSDIIVYYNFLSKEVSLHILFWDLVTYWLLPTSAIEYMSSILWIVSVAVLDSEQHKRIIQI